MILVVIAWLYVVLMIAVVEATSTQGTVLGAVFTFLLYGVLPLAIISYLFFSPARRRAARVASTVEQAADVVAKPDGGDHPPGDAVAPIREEP
jgi:mannose/fructose/N-acetylgalactosamine-specific phosphotransferase system component IID